MPPRPLGARGGACVNALHYCLYCAHPCRSVLRELQLEWLPVHRNWRLNERHYGALQVRDQGMLLQCTRCMPFISTQPANRSQA